MSNHKKSAYPIPKDRHETEYSKNGLTKLEYFTAAALQGILANADVMREATRKFESANRDATDPIEFGEAIGRLAILYAKGALNELERS